MAKSLGSDGLFYFISICNFGSFKNPFATITSLSELYFSFRKFICWYELFLLVRSDFYELWQQHKQLKITEMSEAGPDIYDGVQDCENDSLGSE